MPLARRLVIFAIADGLVLQNASHGAHLDQHQAVRIEWKTGQLTPYQSTSLEKIREGTHVESHGVVGLLNIASTSFLISITRREQVAHIFGKPVYVIKDVTIVPLSSKFEAEKALQQPRASAQKDSEPDSDSEASDTESLNYDSLDEQTEPVQDAASPAKSNHTRTPSTIAQDVIGRRGVYAKVASQWFTKSGWSQPKGKAVEKPSVDTPGSGINPDESMNEKRLNEDLPAQQASTEASPSAEEVKQKQESEGLPSTSFPLMPRLLRATKSLLSSTSFYLSYDIDITRRFSTPNAPWSQPPTKESLDPLYFWNRHLVDPFLDGGFSSFFIPIMQGFVGQTAFLAKRAQNGGEKTQAVASLEKILEADEKFHQQKPDDNEEQAQPFLLTVISRRSIQRSGLRYLRRGIDDLGHTANTAETEQLLSSPTWDDNVPIRSFVQIRGSIPLYFSQSPYSLKPWPILHRSKEANETAFSKHFEDMTAKYGKVQISMLVDKHGSEAAIGQAYETYTDSYNEKHAAEKVDFHWFDFHAECRGMKFEKVSLLIDQMKDTLNTCGETVIQNKKIIQNQAGIIRTNCMDCLDRTNVVESAYAQYILEQDLKKEGFEIDFKMDPSTLWFGALWSDNGDNISREYAGTAALKGDFTRTRKRTYRGALGDFSLTLGRYYSNIVNDYFAQTAIDYLLGTVTMSAFEDFEADMKIADPGVNLESIRQKAIETCRKMVVQDEQEDLIGGWTVLSPKLPNTLRTTPFEESILLLTDWAIYTVKFDWNTEKVGSFECIDLKSITGMRYGPYVTSTLTERQMDESRNLGILVTYSPSKDSMIRVNTRSLNNSVDPLKEGPPTDQNPTNSKSSSPSTSKASSVSKPSSTTNQTSRFMAVKIIPGHVPLPSTTTRSSSPSKSKSLEEALLEQTEQIADEIQRAVRKASLDVADYGGSSSKPFDGGTQIGMEKAAVISAADARKNTGVLEYVGHQVKKLVWG